MSKKIKCRVSGDDVVWNDCPVEKAIQAIIACCLDEGAPVETISKLISNLINGETVSIYDFSYELEFSL
jgi:hypothetical protein